MPILHCIICVINNYFNKNSVKYERDLRLEVSF